MIGEEDIGFLIFYITTFIRLFRPLYEGPHSITLDYALGIVVFTILIRLCLLPLDLKQRNNQSKMSALGPEIQSLQKRYANNPQQLQKKQQELYRKMNVKPMLGCLPALIQLPILFAFFGAMRVLQKRADNFTYA